MLKWISLLDILISFEQGNIAGRFDWIPAKRNFKFKSRIFNNMVFRDIDEITIQEIDNELSLAQLLLLRNITDDCLIKIEGTLAENMNY